MLKLLLELTPEQAKNLLYLIHNTKSVMRSVEQMNSGTVEGYVDIDTFAKDQAGVLDNISGLTKSLEDIFGKE